MISPTLMHEIKNERDAPAVLFTQFLIVCVRFTGTDGPSGFGFELTFRLKRETGETAPPTWPAELMQGLARYVFQSGKSTEVRGVKNTV